MSACLCPTSLTPRAQADELACEQHDGARAPDGKERRRLCTVDVDAWTACKFDVDSDLDLDAHGDLPGGPQQSCAQFGREREEPAAHVRRRAARWRNRLFLRVTAVSGQKSAAGGDPRRATVDRAMSGEPCARQRAFSWGVRDGGQGRRGDGGPIYGIRPVKDLPEPTE